MWMLGVRRPVLRSGNDRLVGFGLGFLGIGYDEAASVFAAFVGWFVGLVLGALGWALWEEALLACSITRPTLLNPTLLREINTTLELMLTSPPPHLE
jgi:hypothetical protein